MVLGLASLAIAGEAGPSDPAAFWEGSRWWIAVEETTPTPVELSAEENFSFRTRAIQAEAVLACPTAASVGKQLDLTCTLVDVAIRATPRSLAHSEALNPGNQKVLDSIVTRLEGQPVSLRFGADGRLGTVDLPQLVATTRRESESRETLRRLVFDLVAGFHLRHDEAWRAGWREKNSALLRAPTQPASSGLSVVHHTVSEVDGATVVQSQGKGTFTAPYVPWEFSYDGQMSQRGSNSGTTSDRSQGLPSNANPDPPTAIDDGRLVGAGPTPAGSTPTDYTFTGTLTSVAVVDPVLGWPIERVWATLGRPNASSIGNMMGLSIYYAGSLRRLGADEQPRLGATEVVAPPGQHLDGIGAWAPLAVL